MWHRSLISNSNVISFGVDIILGIAWVILVIIIKLGLDLLNFFGISLLYVLDSIFESFELIVEVLDALVSTLDDWGFG